MIKALCCVLMAVCLAGTTQAAPDPTVKEPNVAGAFYSADPQELSAHIDHLKQIAGQVPLNHKVELAIAPHAGYAYSGAVAAHTFKALARNHYKTIVVIAPSHFFPFAGISVWPQGGFKTPLGTVEVDQDFSKALLAKDPRFQFLPQVFEREHALEVELPFIQKTFADVKIVPILMGQPDFKVCEALAAALDQMIGKRDDVLVLISSDMSHYHTYDVANQMDGLSLKAIEAMDAQGFFNGCLSGSMEMCGFVPVTTALLYAKRRGLKHAEVLNHANSGDVTTDKERVVGYGSVIFYSDDLADDQSVGDMSSAQKKQLLNMARSTLDTFVKTGKAPEFNVSDERLLRVQGAFVTLQKQHQLRGCIGNIIGQEPLWQTVRDMAMAAASKDPRFAPVKPDELKDIHLEISVLSVPKQAKAEDIMLGRDGVIVSDGNTHQGVFLPQVADETGWGKEEFLSELCSQKAGLKSDCWKDPDTQLYTFTANVFAE